MDLIHTIILSAVEGFTEFLPISSTAHLVLASEILGIEQTEFVKSFEIIIQLGAILAIVFLYWKKLLLNFVIISKIIIAFLPTALLGFLFYDAFKKFLLGNVPITLAALFLGGLVLIVFEKIHKEKENNTKKIEELSNRNAFLIGLFQSIALIPGVSRAAATILGALLLGAKRKTAVEFSFLLAVPTMLSATLLDVFENNLNFSGNEIFSLCLGFFGSFVFAVIAVKFLLKFVETHTFVPFGIYRILLSIVSFLFLL